PAPGPAVTPAPTSLRAGARGAMVGRSRERAQLEELIGGGGLVTAIGPGGVGKSRLATEIADRTAAHTGTVPRVALLACVAAGAGDGAVAAALGFESAEAAAVVLADDPGLLLLDNCEPLLDGVRRFVLTVRSAVPDVAVLATSREPLSVPGERIFVVSPLRLPAPGSADAAESP